MGDTVSVSAVRPRAGRACRDGQRLSWEVTGLLAPAYSALWCCREAAHSGLSELDGDRLMCVTTEAWDSSCCGCRMGGTAQTPGRRAACVFHQLLSEHSPASPWAPNWFSALMELSSPCRLATAYCADSVFMGVEQIKGEGLHIANGGAAM